MLFIRSHGPRVERIVRCLVAPVLSLVLIPSLGMAQTADKSNSDSTAPAAGAPAPVSAGDAAVIKELEAMKARIAELEAQLKAQSTANANATATEDLSNAAKSLTPPAASASSAVPTAQLAASEAPAAAPAVDKMTPFGD